jgi:hypothetical protein
MSSCTATFVLQYESLFGFSTEAILGEIILPSVLTDGNTDFKNPD